MSLVYFDGFEGLTTATILDKWDFSTFAGSFLTILGTGRRGGNCLHNVGSSETCLVHVPIRDTYIAGTAYRPVTPVNNTGTILVFWASNQTWNIQIRAELDGRITVRRGFNGTQLDITTNPVLVEDDFVYVEAKVLIDNAAGSVEVRVNGSTVINLTVEDTLLSGVEEIASVGVGGANTQGVDHDDFYVLNLDGPPPYNTFLGDVRVDTLFPTGDGAHTEIATVFPAFPTTSWDKLDEVPWDDDTSYIESSVANQRSLFNITDLPPVIGGATVYGVQIFTRAKKTLTGNKTYRTLARPAGANFTVATHGLPSDYNKSVSILTNNPATGVAWGEPEIDTLQVGMEVL